MLEQWRWPGPTSAEVGVPTIHESATPASAEEPFQAKLHSTPTAFPGPVLNYSAIKLPVSFSLTFLCN